MNDYRTILLDVDADGIAWLTFHRPEVRNALDQAMVDEVRHALRELATRDDVRVLVLRGAGGKAFLGGADIRELRDRTRLDALRRINSELFREVERFPAPTIAAIEGYALGGGCEVALACDLRICTEDSKLGQPEVGLGIIPGAGATYRLPRLVGLGRAKELIFTGRLVSASEAQWLGLVERVVPRGRLEEEVRELARSIARNGRLAVRLAKQALNAQADGGTEAWQVLESALQAILFEDPEKRERMTAFLERKRGASGGADAAPPARLSVSGAVDTALSLDFDALRAFPPEAQVPDVSSVVPKRQGSAVRLPALLERAGLRPDAAHVTVRSADGDFSTSQPLDVAQRALIVYALGGNPLPEDKGGPFRLLIPDPPDTCANVKGVASIEASREAGESRCAHEGGH
ncbi:MAG: hypothetical protein D6731_01405 [Planctomycetota bacterium]|nr:MAG: hypothetical protein D6731_01405 [Planctomycetota bacterium]